MELIFRGDRPLGPSEVYTTGDSGGFITILNKQGMTLEDVLNIHFGLFSYLYHFFGVPWPSVPVPIPAVDFVIRNQQNGTIGLGRLFRTETVREATVIPHSRVAEFHLRSWSA